MQSLLCVLYRRKGSLPCFFLQCPFHSTSPSSNVLYAIVRDLSSKYHEKCSTYITILHSKRSEFGRHLHLFVCYWKSNEMKRSFKFICSSSEKWCHLISSFRVYSKTELNDMSIFIHKKHAYRLFWKLPFRLSDSHFGIQIVYDKYFVSH